MPSASHTKNIQTNPTAIVHPKASIGHGTVIEPYAIVGEDVTIGQNCRIGSHSVIEYTQMGDDCTVFPFASLGLPPQHLGYKGEKTKLVIGNRCTFREGVTVHRGSMFDKGITQIGDDGYFMAYSHVAHDCRIGNKVTIVNGSLLAGHIEVGDNCFISGLTALHQFTRIGRGAMISGGAMVPQDVAPFCIAQGDRAVLKGINLVGLKRMGVPRTSITNIKTAYKTVFLSNLGLDEALKQDALNIDDEWVAIFRDFFSQRKRGFIRPDNFVDSSVSGEAES